MKNTSRCYDPAIDIYEMADSFVVLADVPGIQRDSLDVKVEDSLLMFSGSGFGSNGEEIGYRKTLNLVNKDGVDVDLVEANLSDGVLRIDIPKAAKKKSRKIDVM